MKDYKAKYGEFEKATKKSKEYYRNFEKELRGQEAKKKELTQHKEAMERRAKPKKNKKNKKAPENTEEDELEKLEAAWEAEKQELNNKRDALKKECSELQE